MGQGKNTLTNATLLSLNGMRGNLIALKPKAPTSGPKALCLCPTVPICSTCSPLLLQQTHHNQLCGPALLSSHKLRHYFSQSGTTLYGIPCVVFSPRHILPLTMGPTDRSSPWQDHPRHRSLRNWGDTAFHTLPHLTVCLATHSPNLPTNSWTAKYMREEMFFAYFHDFLGVSSSQLTMLA